MRQLRQSLAVADGCRLVIARQQLGDIDAALAFLGLARSEFSSAQETSTADSSLLSGDLLDLFEGGDHELEPDFDPDQLEDDRVKKILQEIASALDQERASVLMSGIGKHPHLYAARPMIAYTLTPDKRNPDDMVEQPTYNYKSVEDRAQRLHPNAATPDPESWRVARQVCDDGPRVSRPGRLDIRECVARIARAEAINHLPRKKAFSQTDEPRILIDSDVSAGLFLSDLDQFQRALGSICTVSGVRPHRLTYRDGSWFAGPGPTWTFDPFVSANIPTWYVIIAGGATAAQCNLEKWEKLVAVLSDKHFVTIVWLGDLLRGRFSSHNQSWISFRR